MSDKTIFLISKHITYISIIIKHLKVGVFMKKIIYLLLVFVIIFSTCSCNVVPHSVADTSSSGLSSDNTDNIIDNEKDDAPTNIVQVKKYYREINSSYTTDTDGVVWENNQIFLDGVFEMKQKSQYKVISSEAELQMFTLLKYDEIEENIFDNNYIVAILHYYIGPSIGAREPVGFYDADFNDEQKIILDTFYNYQYNSTEDERDIYRLHFIVVPKEEISNTEEINLIEVNVNKIEQYDMYAYAIDTKTEEVKAYYLNSEEAKQSLDILSSVEHFWIDSPCIAIHLSDTIKTDFIVNDFKYENGEIFITVEIFEKTEMNYLHEISSNLILVSLRPHRGDLTINVPDNIPTECKVNVVFKNVVSVN